MARKRKRKKSQPKKEPAIDAVVVDDVDEVTEDVPEVEEAEAKADETPEKAEEATKETDEKKEETEEEAAVDVSKELADVTEKYMRTRAEMENFRKRKVKEIDDARRSAKIAAIEEIMPVMDQFQMAVAAMDGASDLETIKMGMKMIQTTFDRAFENLGVDKVSSVGLEFDPLLHEAVSMETSEETPADHVIREWKSGYKIGDFLIRPASVVVSSGEETEAEEPEESDTADEDVTEAAE
jgi:molecular chaperone GrpE